MTLLSTNTATTVAAPAQPAAGRSLIVLDGGSTDLSALQSGARLPLALINPCDDPLAAVAELLRSRSVAGDRIEILHLVCHGRPGAIRLAGQWLDGRALRAAAADLSAWSLPRIVLWSCEVGQDGDFIATLSELSGASVLASIEVLGHETAQSIEGSDGVVHRLTDLFHHQSLADWSGRLNFTTATQTISIGDAGLDLSNGIRLTTNTTLNKNPLGTTFLYQNAYVDPVSGQTLDVLITIQELIGARVSAFDSEINQFNETSYFQPSVTVGTETINGIVGGSARFHFQFIEGGSYSLPLPPEGSLINYESVTVVNVAPGYDELRIGNETPYTKVNISNLSFTAFDIDGQALNSSARQFVETTSYDPTSITEGNTSELNFSVITAEDNSTSLRILSLNDDDSNPNIGSDGFDASSFLAHQATVGIGGADNFDLIVGDTSTTSSYLAFFGIVFNGVTASLGDRLWLDANANGLQDDGESGIAGRTVTLIGGGADGLIATTADNTTATTTTGEDGLYSFAGLMPGVEYQVLFGDKPAGSVFSTPNVSGNILDITDSDADTLTGKTQIVTPAQGDNITTLDAGVYELATLSGYVYQDLGNDGVRNSEPPIAGVTLTLTGIDGAGNPFTATATTGSDGFYQFTGLVPGTYTVSQSQPSGYLDGRDTPGSTGGSNAINDVISGIVLTSGANSTENNFGEILPASLGDRVWFDTNGNGRQDDGESGASGVTVILIGGGADGLIATTADNTTATATTNASGNYAFTGLTPDVQYQVGFSNLPSGYSFTTRDAAGVNDADDSDADSVTGITQIVTLSSGENNTSLDAGLVPVDPGDPPSLTAPGVRTPGFWQRWTGFWDGNALTRPDQTGTSGFPTGDLLLAPHTNAAVVDPVTGNPASAPGLLIGDFNRNGRTDSGEDTLFYTLSEASILIDSSKHPSGDQRYTLGRSLAASWLNYLAGNPIDTAAANDKDARFYIREGVNWLQALTPDENGDKKGDGLLSGSTSPAIARGSTFWTSSFTTLPTGVYSSNTNVVFTGGIDSGNSIHSSLDSYNNGRGFADGVSRGG